MARRASGILMHVTSLPSDYGIGDLGPKAYSFCDFLAAARQSYWQVLPLSPTVPIQGYSPYSSTSAFAGNPLITSPDLLVRDGLVSERDVGVPEQAGGGRVNYQAVVQHKTRLLDTAYGAFAASGHVRQYEAFRTLNEHWLEDFALYTVFKRHFDGKVWNEWPREIRDREQGAIKRLGEKLSDQVRREKFVQYVFFKQWFEIKSFCNERGIQIIGDIPMYVSYDGADTWANPGLFKLNRDKTAAFVAGVPPDYFSTTGQLWGNPVYNWDAMRESGYRWWIKRMEHMFGLYDIVRIDHLRGLVAYWEVPSGEKTAVNGQWVRVPAEDFFDTMLKHFPQFPIIAEDLGLITPDVREIMNRYGFPGMKVLLFAFDEDNPRHPYLPHNFERDCVVYTGTHDNNTIRGWFDNQARPQDRQRLFSYLGRDVPADEVAWELVRLAVQSVADLAILPMQDVLGLGQEARMNLPGVLDGNWGWRLSADQVQPSLAARLAAMTDLYARS